MKNRINKINKIKKNNPEVIGNGTFGCVLKPQVPCINENPEIKNQPTIFISKLQQKNEGSEREEKIGKRIKEIKKYATMYAPIIDSCDITIEQLTEKVDKTNIENCDIIAKDMKIQNKDGQTGKNVEYKSYKMKFSGKQTLGNYITSLTEKHPKKLLKQILETHIYLLKSIDKLTNLRPPIIHYDLKENNIMWDDVLNVPILIDFGLSIEIDIDAEYNQEILANKYYVFYAKYPPWCIEIVLLSYIVKEVVGKNKKDSKSIIADTDVIGLKEIVSTYISESSIFTQPTAFTQEEVAIFKEKLYNQMQGYLGKSWEVMFHDLQTKYATWDNYALAVMYMFFIIDIIESNKIESLIIEKYKSILKKVILTQDQGQVTTRLSNTDTLNELNALAKTIDKKEYKKLQLSLESTFKNKQQVKNAIMNINKRTLNQFEYPQNQPMIL